MTSEGIDWREIAEDGSNNPEARLLAAAIHTAEQRKHHDFMRQLVSDLGEDRIEQVMRHLVTHGFATWRVRPKPLLGGRRVRGSIEATWEGSKRLEAALSAAEEAGREAARQARPWGKVKRMCAAAWQGLRSTAEAVTTIQKLVLMLAFVVGVAALVWPRGCGP